MDYPFVNDSLATLQTSVDTITSGTMTSTVGTVGSDAKIYKVGKLCIANIIITITNTVPQWGAFIDAPEGYRAENTTFGLMYDPNGKAIRIYVAGSGRNMWTSAALTAGTQYQGVIVYFSNT